jgi:outer membrane protein assembly factor BamE (lipoprotein component of BamABCDE complex)
MRGEWRSGMSKTKETHVMNDGKNEGQCCKNSFSNLRHCFLVRRSSFFISSVARLILVVVLAAQISCVGNRLTKANVDEVAEGMSKKQVESILGPPTTIDNKDFILMKKTTYIYRQGNDTVTIVFKDDKVTDKQSTLSN